MRRKLGSRGFTLVELLIGITILAIVVVPLVTAFITSAKATSKAKEIRSQTLAAQNIVEYYKARNISAMISDFKSKRPPFPSQIAVVESIDASDGTEYNPVTPTSMETTDGPGYKITMTGAPGITGNYDAILYIEAAPYSQNATPIVDYKPMDALYPQPDPVKDPDNDPDVIAAKDFAAKAQIDSGAPVSYTIFQNAMTRFITLEILEIPSQPGSQSGVISCKVNYHYDTTYTYTITSLDADKKPVSVTYTKTYTYDYYNDFYSRSYSPNQKGLSGLYFFYYPNSTNKSDTIEIKNLSNVDCSVYLIRQSDDDTGYNPVINLYETYESIITPQHTTIHYNNLGNFQYTSIKMNKGFPWYTTKSFDGILVDTEPKNRIYSVRVELYTPGLNYAPNAKLASFDASSFNK